jgi:hypothetical protein
MMGAFVTEAIGDSISLPVKLSLRTTYDHAGRNTPAMWATVSRAKSRPTCRSSKQPKSTKSSCASTAKALGVTAPLTLLGRADEVIE